MEQVDEIQAYHWLAQQRWLSLADDSDWRFKINDPIGLTRYEFKISEGSSWVGCSMAGLFLHDIEPSTFEGAMLWVVRILGFAEDEQRQFNAHVIRGCGASDFEWRWPLFFQFGPGEFDACFTMTAMALMFGWDANLVLSGRRFLLEMDDEPFSSLITDSASTWFSRSKQEPAG